MGFMSRQQLESVGFASIGEEVYISDKASIYNPSKIVIGNHVRIDDFCVLSAGAGGIILGNFIHIAVYSLLIGGGRITMDDFSGLSSRVSVYSSNDDYTGRSMTNPMVPTEFTGVKVADVSLRKHVIVGSGSVILPGVILDEGVAIGSLSLVKSSCEPYRVYAGNPAQEIGRRRDKVRELEIALKAKFPQIFGG